MCLNRLPDPLSTQFHPVVLVVNLLREFQSRVIFFLPFCKALRMSIYNGKCETSLTILLGAEIVKELTLFHFTLYKLLK